MDASDSMGPAGDAQAGQVILNDRYVLGRQIGAGGGGVVYQGRTLFALGDDGQLDRDCAIKLMHQTRASDEAALRRFIDEAMCGYRLTAHPNLIATRDFGRSPDGRLYLVMDLAGQTVEQLAHELVEAVPIVRAIAEGVLSALEHLHSHGVVHGDLYPGNVYLRADGAIKVGDLGRSSCWDGQDGDGTIDECWQAEASKLRPADDLRRFGLMLGKLVGGQPPLGRPIGLDWLPEDTPRELRACISRALSAERESADNALSAGELRALLRDSRQHIASRSMLASWLLQRSGLRADAPVTKSSTGDRPAPLPVVESRARSSQPPARPAAPGPGAPAERRPTRLSRTIALVAVTGLIGGLAGSALTSWLNRPASPSRASGAEVVSSAPDRARAPAASRPSAPVNAGRDQSVVSVEAQPGAGTTVLEPGSRETQKRYMNRSPATSVRERRPRRRPKSFAQRLAERTDRVRFGLYSSDETGVQVLADVGQWLEDGIVRVVCYVDNRSDRPFRLTHVQVLDDERAPVPMELGPIVAPMYPENGAIGVVPVKHVGMVNVRVLNANDFAGRPLTFVFSERGGVRSLTVSNIQWQ